MRFTIVRDGERTPIEVADDLGAATVDGRTVALRVVARGPLRVELEIAGEKFVVDQWPEHFAAPPGPVDVDGERWTVEVVPETPARPAPPPAVGVGPAPPPAVGVGPAPPAPAPSASADGIPILPPMPGKVVVLRVKDGDPVTKGQVLLVLEAMKMRNEVPSPAAGVVRGVSVVAGTNVRAREPMLFVVEGPGP